MFSLPSISKLSYLTFTEYHMEDPYSADYRHMPRPHYVIALILHGYADFYYEDTAVRVNAGEMVFIPLSSCYHASWFPQPDIRYISMHFSFDGYGPFSREQMIPLQRVIPQDPAQTEVALRDAMAHQHSAPADQLRVLAVFNLLLSSVLSQLVCIYRPKADERIERAVDYIIHHYMRAITIAELASIANMSPSYFLYRFPRETGLTVSQMKNRIRIEHAMLLLIGHERRSVEEISSDLGFESATYFRRVFKKETEMSPTEYRKKHFELQTSFLP